jgi:microcystin-dependent protein
MAKEWVAGERLDASDLNLMVVPCGAVLPFAGTSIPSNWLLCDGSAVSRSTYSDLFSKIGTTFGSGDGSTTFNLPNLKGKVPVGLDASQTEFDTLGETGGAKTHTLTISEMPAHDHTGSYGQGFSVGSSVIQGLTSNSTATQNVPSQGGGQAHNNLQPYLVLRFIIRY